MHLHKFSSGGRSPNDPRFAQYQSIDLDRTRAANRSVDKNKNANQYYIRDGSNEENHSDLGKHYYRDGSYDNVSTRSNENLPSSKEELRSKLFCTNYKYLP